MPRLTAVLPDLEYEIAARVRGFSTIAGVDEVGRGSWAGPLVAGAVIFPPWDAVPPELSGVRDSKMLSAAARDEACNAIRRGARAVGVGWVAERDVDLLGLTRAGEQAMLRALRALAVRPDYLLVDGFRLKSSAVPQDAIVGGDGSSLSVAAASIVAKVLRDRWMVDLDREHPGYGFASHKGYGCSSHGRMLEQRGASAIHRYSYAPVAPHVEWGRG